MKKYIGAGLVAGGVALAGGSVYFMGQVEQPLSGSANEQITQDDITALVGSPVETKNIDQNSSQDTSLIDQPALPEANMVEEVDIPVLVIDMGTDAGAVGPEISETSSEAGITDAVVQPYTPIIEVRDPTLATEKGMTVTVYPSVLNERATGQPLYDSSFTTLLEERFDDANSVIGRYQAGRQLFKTDANGRLPNGMMAPASARHQATAFIDIPSDGYYYIYPIEDMEWKSNIAGGDGTVFYRNGPSYIFQNHRGEPIAKHQGVVTAYGAAITMKVGSETVFDFTYTAPDGTRQQPIRQVFPKVYLEMGRYPFEAVFSAVSPHLFEAGYPGINIMVHKSQSMTDESWDFIYANKTKARLFTQPLPEDGTSEAQVSDPVDVTYMDAQHDLKTIDGSQDYVKRYKSGDLNHFRFTLTPEVAGTYALSQLIHADPVKSVYLDRTKESERFSCFINGSYSIKGVEIGFRDDSLYFREGRGRGIANAVANPTVATSFLSGGSVFILDVTAEMISQPVEIDMDYACSVGTWTRPSQDYVLTPILKTPSNSGYLPLIEFSK